MFQSRNDKIDRLENKVQALTKGNQATEQIELLESIIPAEMAAVEALHRVCGVGRKAGDAAVAERLKELRALTQDDDRQWTKRTERLVARSLRLQGLRT